MGLFSRKHLVAELKIGFLDKREVFVSFKNIPIKNGIEMFEKTKLPFIVYVFFLDRILGNMSEKTSIATLNAVHTLATQFLNKIISEISNEEEWQKRKSEFKTPNQWTFTDSEDNFLKSDFKTTAKLFLKGDRLFCETDFSNSLVFSKRGNQLVEAKAYLLVESLLFFITQESGFEDYAFYFLPALLGQCSFYNGKRPGITQLGQAVNFGLMQAEEVRKKHDIDSQDPGNPFIEAYNQCATDIQNILTKNFKDFVDRTIKNKVLCAPMITGYLVRCAENKLAKNRIRTPDGQVKEILESTLTDLEKVETIANYFDKHDKIGIGEIAKSYCLLPFEEIANYFSVNIEDYINSILKQTKMDGEEQELFYELCFRNAAFGYVYKIAEELTFD